VALVASVPFALVAWRRPDLLRPVVDMVPAGDLLGLVRPVLSVLRYMVRGFGRAWSSLLLSASAGVDRIAPAVGPAPADPERGLRSWPTAGASWLIITALLLLSPLVPSPGPSKPGVAIDVLTERPPIIGTLGAPSESPDRDWAVEFDADTPASMKFDDPTLAPEEKPKALPELVELPESPAGVPESAEVAASPSRGPLESMANIPDKELPRSVGTASAPADVASDERSKVPISQASQGQAVATETAALVPGSEERPCDPDRRFVFTHPRVPDALELVDCLRSESGARPLDAPPLTNQLVLLVQHYLNDLGYDAGPTDGLIGPRTREAIRRFQLSEGRRSTGIIDYRLLQDLDRLRNESNMDRE
jgi:hypothetical protein